MQLWLWNESNFATPVGLVLPQMGWEGLAKGRLLDSTKRQIKSRASRAPSSYLQQHDVLPASWYCTLIMRTMLYSTLSSTNLGQQGFH